MLYLIGGLEMEGRKGRRADRIIWKSNERRMMEMNKIKLC